MNNQGTIQSCDLHENKLKRVREGAERLGVTCVETAAADGRRLNPDWVEAFDVVLVDAPCSGLGIIRKKPDTRYKKLDDLFAWPVVDLAKKMLDGHFEDEETFALLFEPDDTKNWMTCSLCR